MNIPLGKKNSHFRIDNPAHLIEDGRKPFPVLERIDL